VNAERWVFIGLVLLMLGLFAVTAQVSTASSFYGLDPSPTPSGEIVSPAEMEIAEAEWRLSAHSDTYDSGMGADTTCARCKSPTNWDPSRELAAIEAQDCGSCKRIPKAPRPALISGVAVPEAKWRNIACSICHIPAGDSYTKRIAFWNQELMQYEAVSDPTELCAKCHEGQHGFEVIAEQESSSIHRSMECTECHGSHGLSSACIDCHDPTSGSGVPEHSRHPSVDCTACHDQGGLSIWQESQISSKHYGFYITRRFAHTLTSWASHNLSKEVTCQKCHHPIGSQMAVIVPDVRCDQCHEHQDGAVWMWCTYFQRNQPTGDPQATLP
jgi:hypothetical protein